MKNIILEFAQYLYNSDYRIKSSAISVSMKVLSGILSVSMYLTIKKGIPSDIAYPQEISFLTTMVISIVLIFPFQEKTLSYLNGLFLSEYLSDDRLSAKIAHKRFDADSLIRNVFPDMVKISNSPSGRLAILNKSETSYDIYSYSRGRQRKVKIRETNINTRLTNLLKSKKHSISITDVMNFPEINDDFMALKSNFIMPFIFREKLFGFLATTNIPSEDAKADLYFLSSKAALAVHNHILSFKVAENKKYKREFETAERIQFFIQSSQIPKIPNLNIELLKTDSRTLIEFYPPNSGGLVFVIFALPSFRKGEGLVLSYISGALYIHLRTFKNNLLQIKEAIENTLKEISYSDPYELLIGFAEKEKNLLQILANSKEITAVRKENPEKNIISLGWRNLIELNSSKIVFKLQENEILSVERK